MMNLKKSFAVACTLFFTTFPSLLGGQDVQLPSHDPALQALIAQRDKLQEFGLGPFDNPILQATSPDAAALSILNESSSLGADYLRAITDLLSVYENMKCDDDRAMLKPLLLDRVQLYSRLLKIDAERAAIPLSTIKSPANTKKALELRDVLVASKRGLDQVAVSLK